MTVNMAQVAVQINSMADHISTAADEMARRLDHALDTMRRGESGLAELRERVATAAAQKHTTWLVAGLNDSLTGRYQPTASPEDFAVLATDGSQILPDRHYSAHCFLINVGVVRLEYGSKPEAFLESQPTLSFRPEDLVITGPGGETRDIEGALFDAIRTAEECRVLASAAGDMKDSIPTVAMMDGTLVLWGLSERAYPSFVIDAILKNGVLKHLSSLKEMNGKRPVAAASYISFPGSTEVVNVLRIARCMDKKDKVDCDHCEPPPNRPCDAVGGLVDRQLFERLLASGERSALFSSLSPVVRNYYDEDQKTRFFYVKADDEIARVEIPAWVAADARLLDMTHAVVLDQCRRGLGYPVALSEAHEQAVVTAADREVFWGLVERMMTVRKMKLSTSAKSLSKRTRGI